MSQTDTIILIFYFHWTKCVLLIFSLHILSSSDSSSCHLSLAWVFPPHLHHLHHTGIQIQLHRWLGYYEGIKLFRNKLTLNFLEGQIILSLKWTYRNNSYTEVFYLSLLLSNLFCKYIFFSFHFYEHVHSICALSCKLTSSSSSNSSSSP